MSMKKLPLGIQTFRKIVEGDYVYVDKTQYIYELINGESYYFLSRPRRFGKSLLLDTIAEAFSGDKELFKGLYIYDSDYSFEKHPVIRIDLSNIANRTPEMLENSLASELKRRILNEGFDIEDKIISDMFKNLIVALYKKYNTGVVVLIDEYDKPILDRLNNLGTAVENSDVLREFYGVLKSMDPFLRFTLITGITKFTKTSVFSGLNNLYDITLIKRYANICGVTAEGLDEYFSANINELIHLEDFRQYTNIKDEILSWYNGYSWDGRTTVLNPYSLLSFFTGKVFKSFWFSSGTPKFLLDLIKKKPDIYINIKNLRITESMLDSTDIEEIDAELILFQTGYLTIKETQLVQDEAVYLLGMPNKEVENAFNLHVVTAFTGKNQPFVKNV